MTEQYMPNLGNIPSEEARRDAVHIAVAPVIAAEDLQPGQHVGLMTDGYTQLAILARVGVKGIGIVDPFLIDYVRKGERFWLFLYPNTVTSLRHVWTHPAFKATLQKAD